MIGTLLRIGWLNLKRDRVAQALTFLLPIVFFSIFAGIFSGQGNAATARIRVAVVDEDGSDFSRRLIAALEREPSLRVRTTTEPAGKGVALDRAAGEALVRNGTLPVTIVVPKGLGAAFGRFDPSTPAIQLLTDVSDPIAPQMVSGLLQKAAMTAAPDLLMKGGIGQLEQFGGPLTPEQRRAVDDWLPRLRDQAGATGTTPAAASKTAGSLAGGVAVEIVDLLRTKDTDSPVAFYAAGVGVMFLLFSCAGAGGSLLEEVESGTLDRLLGSSVGMTGLLAGKWLFLTIMGCLQLTLMFVWGALVFGLDLIPHLGGFAVMTIATAAAASALGLVLATVSRTRAQLSGISTIVILTMSAIGGSMFPRFLMSETMQRVGLITFNAWALDGYIKVFWRNVPTWQLWPQVTVLLALNVVFFLLARMFARRWETV